MISFTVIGIFLFIGYFLIGDKFVNTKAQNITSLNLTGKIMRFYVKVGAGLKVWRPVG